MVKIECYCLFDIANTGVTGRVKNVTYPWITVKNLTINSDKDLADARNRQRNFDTILQLIGLRTQIFDISDPIVIHDRRDVFPGTGCCWMFTFEIEPQSQWTTDGDDFWLLKQDSDGTPMITGLGETPGLNTVIDATGPTPNIVYRHA